MIDIVVCQVKTDQNTAHRMRNKMNVSGLMFFTAMLDSCIDYSFRQ